MQIKSTTTKPGNNTPAGDVDYGAQGDGYVNQRRTDPRIAAFIHAALGDARTVLNVGAGTGSYEPQDRYVLAIEPSDAMRAQRPAHLVPAVHGVAERLPLDDQSVDASMALVTLHQWRNLDKGLSELRRVTRGPIVILTGDSDLFDRYWFAEYAPELIEVERRRFPSIQAIVTRLGSVTEVKAIPIPMDCVDGFKEAYYARPEAFLDPAVRRSQSSWSFVSEAVQQRIVQALANDLKSGEWEKRYGFWRRQPFYEGSLRLVISHAEGRH